ncbi:MAG: hypothetical protein KDC92_15870, partial [Bacteroidetes bacterium]|nr:hypothetical protein [Bacteroidota bacterium]
IILVFLFLISAEQYANAGDPKHCKCRGWAMTARSKFSDGKHTDILKDGKLQHPITTFSRENGGWYNPDDDQSTNLASLRQKISSTYINLRNTTDNRMKELYEDILAEANESIGTFDITIDGHESDNARIAKAAAMVYLVNMNDDGTTLSSPTTYRDKAINAIQRLKWSSSENPDDYYYKPRQGGYSNRSYWLGKTLIMLLQAYDYLKAVEPNNSDVIECGRILQCYTRHLYEAGASSLWGHYFRRNNHSLMIAGAVGLASVVLADHGASNLEPNYQPAVWAASSNWRILKTLFDDKESKHESTRGDINGFGEGPHYFRMSFENLMPFFLAYKNGNPTIDQTKKFKPKGEARRWFSFPREQELETTYWDDPDIENLIIWFSDMKMPSGEYLNTDDSHVKQHFSGIVTYRKPYLTKHLINENFASLDKRYVDFRPDILAALSEGFLLEEASFKNNLAVHASGDANLTLIGYGSPDDKLKKIQTLYFNAENEANGTHYLPITKKQLLVEWFGSEKDLQEFVDAHEQWDPLNIILAQGG